MKHTAWSGLLWNMSKALGDQDLCCVFITHEHTDRKVAGIIKEYLEGNRGIPTFVARDTIKISDPWSAILANLKSRSLQIVLLGFKFESSPWANREVGFCVGQAKRIVTFIFIGGRNPFWLFDDTQGRPWRSNKLEENIELVVNLLIKDDRYPIDSLVKVPGDLAIFL